MKDKNGNTPLSVSIKYNANEKNFHFLLAQNDTLSTISDYRFNTLLHLACMYRCCKEVVVTLLSSAPAAFNMKNRNGLKPVDLVMRSSYRSDDIIDLLQDALYSTQEKRNKIDV